MLSGIPPAELVEALRRQDVRRLVAVPGVGKKTAERMVLELAEKVANLPGEAPSKAPAAVASDDVLSALVNLGYRKAEAERAVDAVGPRQRARRLQRLPEGSAAAADVRLSRSTGRSADASALRRPGAQRERPEPQRRGRRPGMRAAGTIDSPR